MNDKLLNEGVNVPSDDELHEVYLRDLSSFSDFAENIRSLLAKYAAAPVGQGVIDDDAIVRTFLETNDPVWMRVTDKQILTAAHALLATSPTPPASEGQEPVAVVGSDFTLLWVGSGPIAPLVERHGINVGSKLYAHPAPQAAQPADSGLSRDLFRAAIHDLAAISEVLGLDPDDGGADPIISSIKELQSHGARDGDLVTVPRDLIGAACSAVDKGRDAPKTLEQLRRYTTGELSSAQNAIKPAQDLDAAHARGYREGVRNEKARHSKSEKPAQDEREALKVAAKAVEDSATVWTGFAMLDAKTCIDAYRAALSTLTVEKDEDISDSVGTREEYVAWLESAAQDSRATHMPAYLADKPTAVTWENNSYPGRKAEREFSMWPPFEPLERCTLLYTAIDLERAFSAGQVSKRGLTQEAEKRLRKLVDTYFNNDCGENVYNQMVAARDAMEETKK